MSDLPQVIVVHKNLAESILSDCFTFTILTLPWWLNYKFMGSNPWLSALLFICFFVFAYGRASSRLRKTCTKQELIEYARKLEAEQ